MSTLAKVFVIIILVLTIVFITMAGTLFHHQKDWRGAFNKLERAQRLRAEGYDRMIEGLNGEITSLQEYTKSKEEEVRLKDSHLSDLREDVVSLTQSIALKRQEFQLLLAEHKKLVDQIDSKDNRIKDLSSENETVTQERAVALNDKEIAETQVARLTRIKNDLEGDLRDLRKEYFSAQKEREDLVGVLDQLEERGIAWRTLVLPGEPVPTIDGKVAAVDDDYGLIILSVGEEDGVKEGFEFTVFRGDTYVASVAVQKLLNDMCGARVLHKEKNETIQVGDSVSTRPGF